MDSTKWILLRTIMKLKSHLQKPSVYTVIIFCEKESNLASVSNVYNCKTLFLYTKQQKADESLHLKRHK